MLDQSCAGGARAAEAVNGVLTAALLALFGTVVVQGGQHADFASLTHVANWGAAPAGVPIVFLSLVRVGFHRGPVFPTVLTFTTRDGMDNVLEPDGSLC